MSLAQEFGELRVLIVEDDRASRMLTAAFLEQLGIGQIKEAADGESALRVLRAYPADVIICDMMMEPMDGVTFVRRVRTDAQSSNPYVPIILVTAQADRAAVRAARDAGVNLLMAKPITLEALRRRIEVVLNERREFILNQTYVGPDRRRQDVPIGRRPNRRRD
ncbi:response regulator [Thalassobaculum salexigens]|uniref:response regulator n=1 Tax=Thalassobaculum salexigens TaxID=455360 RepID=UPI00248F226A|nr:response regulator [Thalassobaculum salexigens]